MRALIVAILLVFSVSFLPAQEVRHMEELYAAQATFTQFELSGEIAAGAPKLSGPAARFQPTCDICLIPALTFEFVANNQIRMKAQRIENRRASGNSGQLTLEFWAHREPITGGDVRLFRLAQYFIGTLPAGSGYNNVSVTAPYLGDPEEGCYYISLVVVEAGTGYRDWATFDNCFSINDNRTGTCCGSPTPSPTPVPSVTPLPGTYPPTVLGTLNESFWTTASVAGIFDPPAFTDTDEGIQMTITGNPASTFGSWQTRQSMDPLEAGTYRLAVRLRSAGEVAANQSRPEVRVRVFPENALRQQFATGAESGSSGFPTELVVYFDHNGVDRWRVAVDLLGFRGDYAGGFTVTNIGLTRVK